MIISVMDISMNAPCNFISCLTCVRHLRLASGDFITLIVQSSHNMSSRIIMSTCTQALFWHTRYGCLLFVLSVLSRLMCVVCLQFTSHISLDIAMFTLVVLILNKAFFCGASGTWSPPDLRPPQAVQLCSQHQG